MIQPNNYSPRKSITALTTIGALTCIASPVIAQDTNQIWQGFYAGVGFGQTTGDIDFIPDPPQSLDDGNLSTFFAGYQIQRNQWVIGGELALNTNVDNSVTGFVGLAALDNNAIDLKLRGGYAINDKFMVYGVAGYSKSEYLDDISDPSDHWKIDGVNYGLGVDYRINDRFRIGAEYLLRDLEGVNPNNPAQTVQIDLDSLSLRAVYSF